MRKALSRGKRKHRIVHADPLTMMWAVFETLTPGGFPCNLRLRFYADLGSSIQVTPKTDHLVSINLHVEN